MTEPFVERLPLMRYATKRPLLGWALVINIDSRKIKFAGSIEDCYEYMRNHAQSLRMVDLVNLTQAQKDLVRTEKVCDEFAIEKLAKKEEEPSAEEE